MVLYTLVPAGAMATGEAVANGMVDKVWPGGDSRLRVIGVAVPARPLVIQIS